MSVYEVIVGNIGNVLRTSDKQLAEADFAEYVYLSKTGYGRAAHEEVTLLCTGEVVNEFIPEVSKSEATDRKRTESRT